MADRKPISRTREFERALKEREKAQDRYVLRLYVTGSTAKSAVAIRNIRRICNQYLRGRFDLKVIDVHQQPVLVVGQEIVAAPTLIKELPTPLRRLIGNLSDTNRVLVGLDLQPAK